MPRLSAPKLPIEPLRDHRDTDEHRQIRDPNAGKIQLCLVDQDELSIAIRPLRGSPGFEDASIRVIS
jgi:hypothetical protein